MVMRLQLVKPVHAWRVVCERSSRVSGYTTGCQAYVERPKHGWDMDEQRQP